MESLAKLVLLMCVGLTIIIEILIVLFILKIFPNLGKWWIVITPITILLSFGVSLLIFKILTMFNN
jgi:hypothetical protein